jgi:3-oxoacyl-[acyl-carrier-protein] synthase-3
MNLGILAIEYYLPEKILTNFELEELHPDWDMGKIFTKTGVKSRHIASETETALDISIKATEKLLNKNYIEKDKIDGIVFCTQSQDYLMPSNSFLIHKHFKFKSNVWTFDINLACSGFIYGLSIIRGMIETGMGKNVLFITSDTYSKYINNNDRSTKVLFGDGGAATLIGESNESMLVDVILESSGNNFDSFYIPAGACRMPKSEITKITENINGNIRSPENIHMNGFSVWEFISKTVPNQICLLLERNNLSIQQIDFFAFHQASRMTLNSLVKTLRIKQPIFSNLELKGNLVSSSLPILIKDAIDANKIKRGDLILLSGFGVGLSWGSFLIKY